MPEAVAAYRWLAEVFEPAVAAMPAELRGKLEAAEVFHEILEHRWFLSEQAGEDVGLLAAVDSYVDDVLRHHPTSGGARRQGRGGEGRKRGGGGGRGSGARRGGYGTCSTAGEVD